MTSSASGRYRFADLTLDTGQHRVWRNGEPIALSRRTFGVLRALVEAAPNLLSHDALADRVWGPQRVVTPDNLSQHVALLRRALGDSASAPRYVEAVRGEGYRLLPAVDIDALHPGMEPAAARTDSVAVLPFVSLSDDPQQEYFADGLSEELMNQLAQVAGLRVIARTSSFSFKGRTADVREIGRLLGVDYVVEGSVRRWGQRVRISAQLISTSDGCHVWSSLYEQALDDIFRIQQDVAASVTRALRSSLAGAPTYDPFSGIGTGDAQAHDKALRARGLIQAGGVGNLLRAETLLREAIASDPDFVLAKAALSRALDGIGIALPARAREARREHARLLGEVEEAAPDHPVNLILQGVAAWNRNDWIAADRAFASARDRAGKGVSRLEAERLTSMIYRTTGRCRDAVPHARYAVEIDPLSLEASNSFQMSCGAAGLIDEAEAEYRRSRDLQGDRSMVETVALVRALRAGLGRDVLNERLARLSEAWGRPAGALDAVIAALDDRAAALPILQRELDAAPDPEGLPLLLIATLGDHLGHTRLAMAAIHRHVEIGGRLDPNTWSAASGRTLATPAFKQLLKDYHVPEYWRTTGKWADACRPVGEADFVCAMGAW